MIEFAGLILRGNARAGLFAGRTEAIEEEDLDKSQIWRVGVERTGEIVAMRAHRWELDRIPIITTNNNNNE